MKKYTILILNLLFFILVGCQSNRINISSNNEERNSTNYPNQPLVKGNRALPVNQGEKFIIETNDYLYGDYKLEITINYSKKGNEAEGIVLSENEFNSPSGENNEYFIVNITFTLLDILEENDYYQEYGFDLTGNFNLITEEGKMYNFNPFAVVPDEISDCVVYKGNTCTGNYVGLVDNNTNILLKYKSVWFKTSNEEINIPVLANEDPSLDYGSNINPVPLGQSQVVKIKNLLEDYKVKITINNVIRGEEAETLVLKENIINEPSGESQEYVIVNVTIALLAADETNDYYQLYGVDSLNNFDFVSTVSGVYSEILFISFPNEISDYSLFVGGKATGNIGYLIENDDEVMIKFGNSFFSIK